MGQQFLLAATKENFEGITTVNKYRAHPVADFFSTFPENILDYLLQFSLLFSSGLLFILVKNSIFVVNHG